MPPRSYTDDDARRLMAVERQVQRNATRLAILENWRNEQRRQHAENRLLLLVVLAQGLATLSVLVLRAFHLGG